MMVSTHASYQYVLLLKYFHFDFDGFDFDFIDWCIRKEVSIELLVMLKINEEFNSWVFRTILMTHYLVLVSTLTTSIQQWFMHNNSCLVMIKFMLIIIMVACSSVARARRPLYFAESLLSFFFFLSPHFLRRRKPTFPKLSRSAESLLFRFLHSAP